MVDIRLLIDGQNNQRGPNLDILYVTTMGKFSPGVADFLRKNPVPAGKSVWPGEYGVGARFMGLASRESRSRASQADPLGRREV